MARSARLVLTALLALVLSAVARPARAHPDDARIEALREGDRDEADLVRPSGQLPVWLSLAYSFRDAAPRAEHAILVTFEIPLERLFGARSRPPSLADPKPQPRSIPEPPPPPPPKPIPAAIRVPPKVMRTFVYAAWKLAGIAPQEAALASLATRARVSGLLPELRLRATRNLDEEAKLDRTTSDARTTGTSGTGLTLEVRLTFRLERLAFADEEPTLERLRGERAEARTKLALRIVELVGAWQRARAALEMPIDDPHELSEMQAKEAESAAALDVLTGGEFSVWSSPTSP